MDNCHASCLHKLAPIRKWPLLTLQPFFFRLARFPRPLVQSGQKVFIGTFLPTTPSIILKKRKPGNVRVFFYAVDYSTRSCSEVFFHYNGRWFWVGRAFRGPWIVLFIFMKKKKKKMRMQERSCFATRGIFFSRGKNIVNMCAMTPSSSFCHDLNTIKRRSCVMMAVKKDSQEMCRLKGQEDIGRLWGGKSERRFSLLPSRYVPGGVEPRQPGNGRSRRDMRYFSSPNIINL